MLTQDLQFPKAFNTVNPYIAEFLPVDSVLKVRTWVTESCTPRYYSEGLVTAVDFRKTDSQSQLHVWIAGRHFRTMLFPNLDQWDQGF